jgi:hypothetical protein
LQIRFELFDDGLAVFYPNGEAFKDPEAFAEERDRTQEKLDRALVKLKELGIDPDQL